MDLLQKKCVPCEGGVEPLGIDAIKTYMSYLQAPWEVIDNTKISKQFKFKDFVEAMIFVNKIADIAESEGHHPDITISYSKVSVILWTHAIGGLSENDFILARKIEECM